MAKLCNPFQVIRKYNLVKSTHAVDQDGPVTKFSCQWENRVRDRGSLLLDQRQSEACTLFMGRTSGTVTVTLNKLML